MSARPAVTGRGEWDALVVRTDYSDEQAWRDVAAALTEPWGDGAFESSIHFIDGPAWADATVDDVLVAVSGDEDLSVVFLADGTTMRDQRHPLLAVTTLTREDCGDDEDYEQLTEFGREFRTVPGGVPDIHANLSIANLGFEDYAAAAHQDPERILRAL
ncbi:DUF6924 domain-containing protein [Streptomyces sp. NPDC059909]|uniref:DUF6924 domain-containing protein n=1 Tax=Streptomyces sp. NPDC059909 TaxID=3346998 RepID=UPI00365C8CEE